MNPIMDIAMLKHHRVDYGRTVDKEHAGPRKSNARAVALITVLVVAIGFVSNVPALV